MQTAGFTFNPPEWRGEPKVIAEMWKLSKGQRTAVCTLVNHPSRRAEIRCAIDGQLHESRAENDPLELFEQADAWKAAFLARNWTAKSAVDMPSETKGTVR